MEAAPRGRTLCPQRKQYEIPDQITQRTERSVPVLPRDGSKLSEIGQDWLPHGAAASTLCQSPDVNYSRPHCLRRPTQRRPPLQNPLRNILALSLRAATTGRRYEDFKTFEAFKQETILIV